MAMKPPAAIREQPTEEAPSATPKTGRANDGIAWPLLGLLRFFLASVVVGNHYFFVTRFDYSLPLPILILCLLGGFKAVTAFLAVSGYSIGASIERERKGFYGRRVRRLAPTYFACLLYSFVPFAISHGHPRIYHAPSLHWPHPIVPAVIGAFAGVPLLFAPIWITFGQTWSLTCEIVYYAFAPWFRTARTMVLILLCVASTIAVIATAKLDYPTTTTLIVAPTLLVFWLSGFLLYRHRDRNEAHLFFALATFLLLPCNPHPAERMAPLTILAMSLSFWFATRITMSGKLKAFCELLGDISYPLYLSHLTTIILLYQIAPGYFASHSILFYPAAVLAGTLIYYGAERPAARWLRRTTRKTMTSGLA